MLTSSTVRRLKQRATVGVFTSLRVMPTRMFCVRAGCSARNSSRARSRSPKLRWGVGASSSSASARSIAGRRGARFSLFGTRFSTTAKLKPNGFVAAAALCRTGAAVLLFPRTLSRFLRASFVRRSHQSCRVKPAPSFATRATSEESVMRKFIVIPTLLLFLLAVAAPALRAQSRPRRVGQTNPAPPTTAPAPRDDAPPVLTGAQTSNDHTTTRTRTDENAPQEVAEDEVVRVNTTLVTLPVSVMDRDGKYVPSINRDEFRIYENGVEQQLAYFATVEKPFTVALVIDESTSTRFKLEEIQDAAIAFIDQLRDDDRVMVVGFDDKVHVLAEPTSDRRLFRDAIRHTHNGGETRLYDAVDFVIHQRFNRIDGRKAIVLFTDGVDTSSHRASYDSNVRDAEELDALVYPIEYDTYDPSADNQGGGWPGGGGGGGRYPRGGSGGGLPSILGTFIFGGGGGGSRGGRRGGYPP